MNYRILNRSIYPVFLLLVCGLTACAKIQVGTLPSPPSTAKLRVFVQAFTTFHEGKGNWEPPHAQFVQNQVRQIERHLAETGVYEIVDQGDVQAVLDNQKLSYANLQENNWQLARRIGKALHADYVMVMERGTSAFMNEKEKYFINILLNVETGKRYGGRYSFTMGRFKEGEMLKIMRRSYRDLFRKAKEDLFATAIKKAAAKAGRSEPSLTSAIHKSETATPASLSAPAGHEWLQKVNADKLLIEEVALPGGARLVVYDLEAVEPYRTAALILSEALREELFLLKRFTLVNRENLLPVLQEISLQQTGLLDEQQAVKMGKGLAANQVVTGRLGVLGKTFVLQAKWIDVETFATLGLASAKVGQGQEETMLEQIPNLARQLVGQP